MRWVVRRLAPHVKLVTPEELAWRVRLHMKTRENPRDAPARDMAADPAASALMRANASGFREWLKAAKLDSDAECESAFNKLKDIPPWPDPDQGPKGHDTVKHRKGPATAIGNETFSGCESVTRALRHQSPSHAKRVLAAVLAAVATCAAAAPAQGDFHTVLQSAVPWDPKCDLGVDTILLASNKSWTDTTGCRARPNGRHPGATGATAFSGLPRWRASTAATWTAAGATSTEERTRAGTTGRCSATALVPSSDPMNTCSCPPRASLPTRSFGRRRSLTPGPRVSPSRSPTSS